MKFEDIDLNLKEEAKLNIIIDTGLGGLNVFKILSQKYPIENFLFYCDNEILPIGNKDPKKVLRRVGRIIKKFKKLEPKSIIIACNTIDAIAGDVIESSFPNSKVIRIISSTVKKAEEVTKSREIALLATSNTINSQAYMEYFLANKNTHVYGIDCPNMCDSIENNNNVGETFKKEILAPLKTIDFDTIILGCTHYYKIRTLLEKNFKDKNYVDSVQEVVSTYDKIFPELINNRADKQKLFIVFTKEDEELKDNYKNILQKDVSVLIDRV